MDSERERFLAHMANLMPQIADQAAAEIAALIESYGSATPPILPGLRQVILRTYLKLLQLWTEDRAPTSGEIDRLVEIAVPPVEARVTLEEAQHTYRIAAQIFWGAFREVGSAHPGLDRAFLLDAADISFQYLNALSTGVTARYVQAERHALQRRTDAEQTVLQNLLGEPPHPGDAARAARALGLDLAGSWWVVVARPRGALAHPSDTLASAVSGLREMLLRDCPGLAAPVGGQVVAVVAGTSIPVLPGAGWPAVCAGVGRPHEGPEGVKRSHHEALDALDIAIRREASFVRFDEAWLERFLVGTISAEDLTAAFLDPLRRLPEDKGRLWGRTLEAYLDAGGSVTQAARALHLHPQSLRYRLARLRTILGRDLAAPEDRLALHIAIKASRLFGDRAEP